MANVLKVQEQDSITQLAAAGWPIRRIARQLGLDRKTVRRYLRGEGSQRTPAEASKSPTISTPGSTELLESKSPISTAGSDGAAEVVREVKNRPVRGSGRPGQCEAHTEFITQRLERGLSAQRIYQDLVSEVGFGGSYQSVKRFVRRLRQAEPQRVWRVEVEPGEEAQVDFGTGAWVVDEQTGSRRRPWVLRVVLSFSRKAYSEAFFRQDTEHFLRGLENAWRAFGGVARTLNLDNLKAGILKCDWADPELNPKLGAFAKHYGFAVLPCRPRTPEHKGKTENGIGYLKGNALRGRSFVSLSAQNHHLVEWERTVADVRIHGTTRQQVSARFAIEKAALLPLPPNLFPVFREARRSVHRDSYIEVERAYYSVPPEYIQCDVWVRWDSREVRVFNTRWEQIALHRRLERGQFSECLGLGGGHGPLDCQLAYWQERAAALGEPCGRWAAGVVEHKGPIGLRTVMGLLALSDTHSFRALNQACESALAKGAWRLRDVRTLLEGQQPATQMPLPFQSHHPLIRNLAEYGLFIQNHA
jgi:transposase